MYRCQSDFLDQFLPTIHRHADTHNTDIYTCMAQMQKLIPCRVYEYTDKNINEYKF